MALRMMNIATTFIAIAATTAGAQNAMGRDELAAMLTGADGDVVVLLAGRVDLDVLDGVVAMLEESDAMNVRFGVANDVRQDATSAFGRSGSVDVQREAIAILDRRSQRQTGWQVCLDWLTPAPGEDVSRMASFLETNYNGSIVVIDNGENDRERYGPANGDDPFEGVDENPVIYGLFDVQTSWGLVTDEDGYRAAWQTIDGFAATDVNGC